MFEREWRQQRQSNLLTSIAIVDDRPTEQYLYPEFVIAQHYLQNGGYHAPIIDPAQFVYEAGCLSADGRTIDIVYNRLVDFPLQQPEHAARVRRAFGADRIPAPAPLGASQRRQD